MCTYRGEFVKSCVTSVPAKQPHLLLLQKKLNYIPNILRQTGCPTKFAFRLQRGSKLAKSAIFQNPREASSRSRICLISLVYVCMYCLFVYLFVSRLLATLTTIQTWNLAHILPLTLSKKQVFLFFDQITVTAASLEKLPCHRDFQHISWINLLYIYFRLIWRRIMKSYRRSVKAGMVISS